MARPIVPESRQRLIDAAERLFHERGYTAVSMADIAQATGIRKASLYHHMSGGKEELFVEIATRTFQRHRDGLKEALGSTGPALQEQLRAAARWLIPHAPLGILAMLQNDMPELTAEHKSSLEVKLWESLWLPLTGVFIEARDRGEIRIDDPNTMVGAFVSMMDGLTYIGSIEASGVSMEEVANDLIVMMLNGIALR